MAKKTEHFLTPIIRTLPSNPGVYQFFDQNEKIIYVGKAKDLKKRVSSYFNKEKYESGKVKVMVNRIRCIQHIVVDTEIDALLLENNLIKKYRPKYNVLLKDDKTYPWICIKNEPFPRIFPTRNLIRDGSKYFGPYASVRMMNTLLELIRQLFQFRTCRLNLSSSKIKENKYKVCLEYHIKNCKGPCEGLQTPEDYNQTIEQIQNILKGNLTVVTKELKNIMNEYSKNYEFEKANIVKEKIILLEKFQARSTVVSPTIHNADVFSIISDEEFGYVNFLKIINGAVVQSHTLEMKKQLDEPDTELLEMALAEIRVRFDDFAPESIIPFEVITRFPDIKYTVPSRGDKKKILELSERNAKYYRMEKNRQRELLDPDKHYKRILEKVQKDLNLKELPKHIECIDISNTQGTLSVGAIVVFKNAKPSKKEYRSFNIKTVDQPNDYASIEEVIFRRYKRIIENNEALPQLLIIDGGKGQLSSAVKSLKKLEIVDKLPTIGIAKRLEEIFFPNDSIPLYLDKRSETLKLIQQLRDEAHRFSNLSHGKRRIRSSLKSELEAIKGIGPKSIKSLIEKFKSVEGIKNATTIEISEIVGNSKAAIIKSHFKIDKNLQ
ncbi:MAG: excinuclease ABC subunit C [Bacteroidetes bacterium]|nr:excinuclease ABC subunit C [Bacteroidota bacterium]